MVRGQTVEDIIRFVLDHKLTENTGRNEGGRLDLHSDIMRDEPFSALLMTTNNSCPALSPQGEYMPMRVIFSQQSVQYCRIISAPDRTCVVDTEYDPLKQHSDKLHVSNTKKTGARQAADHMINPTNESHR